MTETASYLGDGVYVEIEPFSGNLVLTTQNGLRVTNKIVLEFDVVEKLLKYIGKTRNQTQAGSKR